MTKYKKFLHILIPEFSFRKKKTFDLDIIQINFNGQSENEIGTLGEKDYFSFKDKPNKLFTQLVKVIRYEEFEFHVGILLLDFK